MSDRKKFSLELTPEERSQIDKRANAVKLSTSEYIRRQALGLDLIDTKTNTYAAAVEAAVTCLPGASRNQIEHAVSRVIITIANQQ